MLWAPATMGHDRGLRRGSGLMLAMGRDGAGRSLVDPWTRFNPTRRS